MEAPSELSAPPHPSTGPARLSPDKEVPQVSKLTVSGVLNFDGAPLGFHFRMAVSQPSQAEENTQVPNTASFHKISTETSHTSSDGN